MFEEEDLGVIIDSELSFTEHISSKVRIANTIVGRSYFLLDGTSFKKLYAAYYAQSVWSPHLRKHINMLENVQIPVTKLVDGLGTLKYSDTLKKLNLATLAYRRLRGDVIELYKNFHCYDKETISTTFQPRERVTRKHAFQLLERKAKNGLRGIQSHPFYYREIRDWNNLPNHTRFITDQSELGITYPITLVLLQTNQSLE